MILLLLDGDGWGIDILMEDISLMEVMKKLDHICDDFEFELLIREPILGDIIFQRKMDVFINNVNGFIASAGSYQLNKRRMINFFQDFKFFFQRFLHHKVFLQKANTWSLYINFFFVFNAHADKVAWCVGLQNLFDGFKGRDEPNF